MRDVTLVITYYDQPKMLAEQLRHMSAYSADIKAYWRLIVVDDASPNHPARLKTSPGFPVLIFRVLRDVPWNEKGARNIGVNEAPAGWLLLTDIDHLVPEHTARALIEKEFDSTHFYGFRRVRAPHNEPKEMHGNSWFLTKDLWNRAGGCDERLSGHYGWDNEWRGRAEQRSAGMVRLDQELVFVGPDVIDDAIVDLPRRTPEADANRPALRKMLSENPGPVTMAFEYERVQ